MRAYRLQHGVNGVSLRIGRVYGPGRRTESIIRTMLDAALAGTPLRLPASGGQGLQYVYDADIVTALHAALEVESLPLTAYNVCGPGSYNDEELAGLIIALGLATNITFNVPANGAQGLGYDRGPLDYSAATKHLGYRPQYDMRAGLSGFLDYLQRSDQS